MKQIFWIILILISISKQSNIGSWHENCEIGKGYDIIKGCTPFFTDETPQIKEEVINKSNSMATKIQSSSDYERFISNVESITFGGWGVSASQSSKYMQSNEFTENTISFQIGEIIIQKRSLIKDVRTVKVKNTVKALIQKNVTEFLEIYGPHVVIGYQTYASFYGTCSVHSQFTKSMSELQVKFDISYSDVFSAKGSEEFNKKVSEMNKHITIQCGTKSDGGKIATVKFDEKTGTNIYEQYLQWQRNLKPYKDIVVYDNWLNIAEIDEIVSKLDYKERNKFMQYEISQTLMNLLSNENTKLIFLLNTVKEQLSSPCQKTEVKKKLEDLKNRLNDLLIRYDLITESILVQMQVNSSLKSQYLKYSNFQNEYDSFKQLLCKPDPVSCISDLYIVQCSNKDDRYNLLPPGYTLIDSDMSKGAKGLYEYLAYKTGMSDTTDIINDILPACEQNKPSDWPQAPGNQGGDINKGCKGCYKYMYYRKSGENICIKELFIAYGEGYTPPDGYVVMGEDLNKGVHGEYAWLVGKKQNIERIKSLKENNQIQKNSDIINQFLKI